MSELVTTEIAHSPENPAVGRITDGYNDAVYYTLSVEDPQDLTPKLREVLKQIAALKIEKEKLAKALLNKARLPEGWKRSLKNINSYGSIEVTAFKDIWREKKEAPKEQRSETITPPKPETPLERLTKLIDIKTLFNSGILTKEEKRKLLDIDSGSTGGAK